MVIALIIISVFAAILLGFIWLLLRALKNLTDPLINSAQVHISPKAQYEPLAQPHEHAPIRWEDVAECFTNVTVIASIRKTDPRNRNILNAVDMSAYTKNNVIQLIDFAQEQAFNEIANTMTNENTVDEVYQAIKGKLDVEDDDEDAIKEMINDVIQNDFIIDRAQGIIMRPPVEHCNIYKMKDGNWIWEVPME